MATGVFTAFKKDHTEYYRTSLTFRNKHISLGSFHQSTDAAAVYQEGLTILSDQNIHYVNLETGLTSFDSCNSQIAFEKYIILLNFRDNGIYFKTPIYLCKNYFLYYLSSHLILKFDVDDLFYYAKHRICSRGGYYYVNDYGMQTSILSRYGIRNHSVAGKDYIFKNGDVHDYRYHNILVVNQFNGVRTTIRNGRTAYVTRIHVNGDYIVGTYYSEQEAAVAYNKAADAISLILKKGYVRNYIEPLSSIEYAVLYNKVIFHKKFRKYLESLQLQQASDINKQEN